MVAPKVKGKEIFSCPVSMLIVHSFKNQYDLLTETRDWWQKILNCVEHRSYPVWHLLYSFSNGK